MLMWRGLPKVGTHTRQLTHTIAEEARTKVKAINKTEELLEQ